MKLGLAENSVPRPPSILVLGEGAISTQIHDDLRVLGLETVSVSELPLTDEQKQIPRVTDIDAGEKFKAIFRAFIEMGEERQHDHSWVHPGVSIWSERSEFEGWARKSGLSAVAAPAKALHFFWNTLQLIKVANAQGVPNLILSDDPVTSTREIETQIRKLSAENKASLPCVLKSAYRVRGGYGARIMRNLDDLKEWVPIWMNHVQESSGASLLYVEKYLEGARYYVQPFARLKNGEIQFFPVVDGSLMFEGKNWIEACPAQNIDDHVQDKIEDYSERILKATDFVGVGNLVFLSNGVDAFFIEALGRLNFAYKLWERVGRCPAIHWQLQALAPGLLSKAPKPMPKVRSEAPICGLNMKIYAEDTWLKIPSPGVIHELSQATEWSEGEHEASLNWGVSPGTDLNWKTSGSIGHLTLFSTSWRDALQFSKKIFPQIWISGGIQTNERFLSELLAHPWVEESMFYTGFVDEEFIPKQTPPADWFNWISMGLAEITKALGDNESWIWMNHKVPASTGSLRWSQRVQFEVGGMNGMKGFFQTGGASPERICIFPISADENGPNRYLIRIRNWFFSVRRSERGRPLSLMALTSGRVHSVFYREGSKIEPRQNVLIIEAHQSLVSHRLPIPVKLKTLKVRPEDEVNLGQDLAELERWSDN